MPGGMIVVLIWVIAAAIAIRNTQYRNVSIFFTNRKLKEIMLEKERIQEENHANEMRSLIANVAHDLKTVSILSTRK
jgi:signal transduction histidine kinase